MIVREKVYNRKKTDDRGFTLVEMIIVVAIMAVLVGILAPQYTKYVEKARRAADVSNMENLVNALKIGFSDPDYEDIFEAVDMRYVIRIWDYKENDGLTIWKGKPTDTVHHNITSNENQTFVKVLEEFAGIKKADWPKFKPKSKSWGLGIRAICDVYTDGSFKITYYPKSFADAMGGEAAKGPYKN